ncbi:hypothetical protein HPB50_001546 [Hyalomma asiaticum]|uniref:Uncharacterized protein n=1 Tax=Hyalomma asiaticum TaxID=266040 RepID=A0ACB7RQF8_HYAAI|nr:hypothetical protein HPB50_001546 [Hyalomma asiaticum]
MHKATTYDEYMSALERVVEQHAVPERQSALAIKAWERRQEGNRKHRTMVPSPATEACAATRQRVADCHHYCISPKSQASTRRLISSSLCFRLHHTTSGIVENDRLPGLTFADDIVLMAESTQEMQALLDICRVK